MKDNNTNLSVLKKLQNLALEELGKRIEDCSPQERNLLRDLFRDEDGAPDEDVPELSSPDYDWSKVGDNGGTWDEDVNGICSN